MQRSVVSVLLLLLTLLAPLFGVVYAAPIAPPNDSVLGYSPTPTPPPSVGPIMIIEILEKNDAEETEAVHRVITTDPPDFSTDPPLARATPV